MSNDIEVKSGTWYAEKNWDLCPEQGPIDLVWIERTYPEVFVSKKPVGQYFQKLKHLSLHEAFFRDATAAKNLVLIIEGLDRGDCRGELLPEVLPDPFQPPSVDLDDIFDDDELEGLVACSKDDPECESCQ